MHSPSIDPDLQSVLDEAPPRQPLTRDSIKLFRETMVAVDAREFFPRATDPVCHVIETPQGPLDVYEFRPSSSKDCDAALLWLHGGGYVAGHGNDAWFGTLFAECAGVRVFSVDYRLAPEHPFPAARDDAWCALSWLAAQSTALGINPKRLAIGGQSAGGGLAAALAIYNRDRSGPAVAFQLLLYPMLDHLHDTESGRMTVPRWPLENSLAAWDMYLNGQQPQPDSVPATAKNLSGLPPAFLSIGEADIFLDEIRIYAQRLQQSNVQAKLRTYPGVYHAAEIQGYATPVGRKMTDDYIAALTEALRL